MNHIDILLESAKLVEDAPHTFDWSRRVALERAVFGIAKKVAATHLAFALVGLSDVTRTTFLQAPCPEGPSKDLIIKAFDVRHALGQVFNGNPYLAIEIGPMAHNALIRHLSNSLREMADLYKVVAEH